MAGFGFSDPAAARQWARERRAVVAARSVRADVPAQGFDQTVQVERAPQLTLGGEALGLALKDVNHAATRLTVLGDSVEGADEGNNHAL
jgi:hypothetical protein